MKNHIIPVVPFCAKVADLCARMLEWAVEIKTPRTHRCVLAHTDSCAEDGVKYIQSLANKLFTETIRVSFRDESANMPWPHPQNEHFARTARFIGDYPGVTEPGWLWIESDCVPLRPDWIEALGNEYALALESGKFFLGNRVNVEGTPEHMSGVAIYPHQLRDHSVLCMRAYRIAWDLYSASEVLDQAAFTPLIQHVYHDPVFEKQSDLRLLDQRAVLFHQDKSGGLIRLLREDAKGKADAIQMAHRTQSPPLVGDPCRPALKARGLSGVKHGLWRKGARGVWFHYWEKGYTQLMCANKYKVSIYKVRDCLKNPSKYEVSRRWIRENCPSAPSPDPVDAQPSSAPAS